MTATKRRYLTKTQRSVLQCMAQSNGRAEITWGVRWSTYAPGFACIFGQGFHTLTHNRWITNRGENSRHSYVWTDEGKLAYERGWYIAKMWPATWLDPDYPPPPARTGGHNK
jgi:hypothetical protein